MSYSTPDDVPRCAHQTTTPRSLLQWACRQCPKRKSINNRYVVLLGCRCLGATAVLVARSMNQSINHQPEARRVVGCGLLAGCLLLLLGCLTCRLALGLVLRQISGKIFWNLCFYRWYNCIRHQIGEQAEKVKLVGIQNTKVPRLRVPCEVHDSR
jgi:hypothetical protein